MFSSEARHDHIASVNYALIMGSCAPLSLSSAVTEHHNVTIHGLINTKLRTLGRSKEGILCFELIIAMVIMLIFHDAVARPPLARWIVGRF